MNIKKGDTVFVRAGKDRGKSGKVLAVLPKAATVVVEGLNVFKKHRRPKRQGEKGEIIQVNRPIAIAKVLPFCGHCRRGVRVGYRRNGEKSTRFCRNCEATLA